MTGKRVVLSVDVERDISRYIDEGYIGVKQGIPPLLDILGDLGIKADFFLTGDVCRTHPEIVKRINYLDHGIGCHGLEHRVQYYSSKSKEWQMKDIKDARNEIKKVIGKGATAFRAPNFSVNSDTIQALESLGFDIDSSVLPGRVVKKWRLFTILDFKGAPREPYRPSRTDIRKSGDSKLLEIPVTENPLMKGIPIGSGYLNYFGAESFIKAIKAVTQSYVVLLFHPWELVPLADHYGKLPEWVVKACKDNFDVVRSTLKEIQERFNFCLLKDILQGFSNRDS